MCKVEISTYKEKYISWYNKTLIIKKAKWHENFTVALDTDYCGLRQ